MWLRFILLIDTVSKSFQLFNHMINFHLWDFLLLILWLSCPSHHWGWICLIILISPSSLWGSNKSGCAAAPFFPHNPPPSGLLLGYSLRLGDEKGGRPVPLIVQRTRPNCCRDTCNYPAVYCIPCQTAKRSFVVFLIAKLYSSTYSFHCSFLVRL